MVIMDINAVPVVQKAMKKINSLADVIVLGAAVSLTTNELVVGTIVRK